MINLRLQSWAGEALSVVCAVLLFVGMFDHMTAIKYIGIGHSYSNCRFVCY